MHQKIGPLRFDRSHHISYYATLQPTKVTAFKSTNDDVNVTITIGQDMNRLLNTVRPPTTDG